jgi:hypothetical protein
MREEEKKELLTIINTTFGQNYLQFNSQFFKQNEGQAMGAPMSVILAETFIQYLEHIILSKILNKHQIIDYYTYVDNILIIYNAHYTILKTQHNTL